MGSKRATTRMSDGEAKPSSGCNQNSRCEGFGCTAVNGPLLEHRRHTWSLCYRLVCHARTFAWSDSRLRPPRSLLCALLCFAVRDKSTTGLTAVLCRRRHLVQERLCCVPHVRPRVFRGCAVAPRTPHVGSRAGILVVVCVRKGGVRAGWHICSSSNTCAICRGT